MLPSRSPGTDTDPDPEPVPTAADAARSGPGGAGPDDGEVMAAVDAAGDRPEFIIADVAREDAWVAVDRADAPVLREWR
jgi:hypothetical protein